MKTKQIIVSLFLGLVFFTHSLYGADQLVQIKKKGSITFGVKNDFDPFGFVSRTGKVIGFDIDMAEYIAKNLGVKAKYKPVTSQNRIDKLLNGEVDVVIASMTHKVERDKKIDFTISYFYDGQAILARRGSKAQSYKDYEGKAVGAVHGASSGKVFEVIQPMAQVVYYDNYDDLIKALKSAQVDAVTSDYAFLQTKAKKSIGKLKVIGKPFTIEPYGIGVRENQSNLRDELNFIIQKSVKTGEYNKIYKKWFNKTPRKRPTLWP